MAQSATDAFFAAPGATTALTGTEDVTIMQGQFNVQCQLVDFFAGLVQSRGGKPTATGAKGSNVALGSLMAALVALGFVIDNTTG
jgi:hypothetical protein